MSQEIEAAQLQRTVIVRGVEHQRIRYGEEAEDWGVSRKKVYKK